jgi:antitoxin component YwqK of YwqJK toxin-antitoxin module
VNRVAVIGGAKVNANLYSRQCADWLAILAALLLAPVVHGAEAVEEKGGGEQTVLEITKAEEVPARVQGQVGQQLKALPEGCKLRVTLAQFFDSGHSSSTEKFEPYVASMVALNAAGNPDGVESFYTPRSGAVRQVPWKDGHKDGIERVYDGGGRVQAEIPWVQDKLDGVKKTFHPDGKVASETTYRQGEITGEVRTFAADGQLLRLTPFKNGKRDGDMTDYWPGRDKVIERVVPYRDGMVEGVSKGFYADGKVKWERPFRQNDLHGVERQYAPDGKVEREKYWIRGQAVSQAEWEAESKK